MGLFHGAQMIALFWPLDFREKAFRHGLPRPPFHPSAGDIAFEPADGGR